MSRLRSALRVGVVVAGFGLASVLTLQNRMRGVALWEGLTPALAGSAGNTHTNYDLTQLRVVNEVLKKVTERYVDPKRVKAREMFLSAVNFVQKDVPQIIVLHEEGSQLVRVRIDTKERDFRVDNVVGPWDVAQRLRDVFAFVQEGLRGTEVDLRNVEYAACNGMLHTLDPHSVLLSPEAFKEMNATTSGQFGGLGIVISLRDQQLTVINPMPATPAGRAGLKKYDRIQKIDSESTLNMGLNEAVNHLRGVPGSKVTIYVHRDGADGWQGVRPFELTRELIKVSSVEHRLLDGNIGYVRLKGFQQRTSDELEQALADLKKSGELKGLVLDLRGNPGGLLDQAAAVVDKFVTAGPLVATVGNSDEDRETKVAREAGTEPNYPLVVLVSGTSASASEIVAGSLKNHERGVIVGETTYGKGSVQLLFPEMPDHAALKLTIAQYLTEPGDISIQGTGVTPDIELDPMTVDEKEMDLTVDVNYVKERDLSRSLSNARAHEGQKPTETVRYNLPTKERQEWRDRGGDPEDTFIMEFPIKFARDLASRLPAGKRLEQVKSAKTFINDVRNAEIVKVSADFKSIGIDWGLPVEPSTSPVNVDVKIETDRPNNEVVAGDSMLLKVSVTNKGTSPIYRLHAMTKSDTGYFDNKELVFGRIEPGKTMTATSPLGFCIPEGYKPGSTAVLPKDAPRICKIPKDAITRADGIRLKFDEGLSRTVPEAEVRASIRAMDRPIFAYGYQVVDNRKGNGDGRVQKDEQFTMYLTVKNVGKGPSFETQANVRNLSGDGLLLHEGRFDLSKMQPGEVRKVAFTFDVERQLADVEAKLALSISDSDLNEIVAEKVRLPLESASRVAAASGWIKPKADGVDVWQSADSNARLIGRLSSSASVLGKVDDSLKVQLSGGRFAFVRAKDVTEGAAGPLQFEDAMKHAPPSIEIAPLASLTTRDNHLVLKGSVTDGERLLDAFIFVGNKKLFYRSNRLGADPRKMTFEADLPLRPGANVITIVSRETPDTTGRKTLIIRRDGPNGELMETPKNEDDLAETFAGAED